MKTKKYKTILLLLVMGISRVFGLTYDELLQNYCNQDIQFEELAISYRQAQLSYEQTLINNGMKITASSGSMKVGSSESQLSLSVSPAVNITIPSLSNTEIKVSVPVSVEKENISFQNAGISLSTEIISSSKADRELTLEKAKRSLLEAEAKLKARVVTLEKSFLNELKSLYTLGMSLYESEENYLSKQISFESMKLQGYSETSSKYKSSLLSVKSAEYDLEKAKRNYSSSLEKFLSACNATDLDIYNLEIPTVELLDIQNFSKEKFSDIENAVWSNYVNSTSRNNKTDFTLSGNASANISSATNNLSSTLGAGLSAVYKGWSGNLNLNIPINTKNSPSVTLSVSWNPSKDKLAVIEEESNVLAESKEALSIKKAYQQYDETVEKYKTEKENLLWQYESNLEELSMYKEMAADTEYWYNNGIVSESEYRKANINYAKAILSVTSSKIEQIIYNLDLQSLFVE